MCRISGCNKPQTCCVPTCTSLCLLRNIEPTTILTDVPMLEQALLLPTQYRGAACVQANFTGSITNPSEGTLVVSLDLATDVESFIDTALAGPVVTLFPGISTPVQISYASPVPATATLVVLTILNLAPSEPVPLTIQGTLTVTSAC